MPRSRLPHRWTPPVARNQAGVFTRAQALEAGVTPAQIRWRRDSGLWVPALGHALRHVDDPMSRWSLLHAAQLTWPDGVVVLGAACFVHGFPAGDDGVVHMVVPRRAHTRPGLVAHRFLVPDEDIQVVDGVRLTTPVRTLLDCFGRLPDKELQRLAAWATARRAITTEVLSEWLDRGPRWGNTRRRHVLELLQRGAASLGEELLHEVLRMGGLRGWTANAPIRAGGRIIASADVLFHAARLVIEIDGFAHHGRSQFQSDRTRQNALVAAGYRVLRFTWEDVTERPDDVLRQVTTMLRTGQRAPARQAPTRHMAPERG